MLIHPATVADAPDLLSIYAPYVQNTAISFEYAVPSLSEFQGRVNAILQEYPYLVAVEGEEILGYAYASSFHSREAYKHSAEVSIYIAQEQRGNGIGKALYQALEAYLKQQNVYTLYACIACTERESDEHLTDTSIRFHQKMGYSTVGKHSLCGYKFDKWYSILWMEKVLQAERDVVKPFVPFAVGQW